MGGFIGLGLLEGLCRRMAAKSIPTNAPRLCGLPLGSPSCSARQVLGALPWRLLLGSAMGIEDGFGGVVSAELEGEWGQLAGHGIRCHNRHRDDYNLLLEGWGSGGLSASGA